MEASPEYEVIVDANNLLVEIDNEICKHVHVHALYRTYNNYVYMYVSMDVDKFNLCCTVKAGC